MKFNLLVSVFAMCLTQIASAQFAPHALEAKLNRFQFDAGLPIDERKIQAAEIVIDFASKKVSLRLHEESNCPHGAMCIVGPKSTVIELPIDSVKRNSCNTNVISASANAQSIQVMDNSQNDCRSFAPLSPTQVIYKTGDTRSTLDGERLQETR